MYVGQLAVALAAARAPERTDMGAPHRFAIQRGLEAFGACNAELYSHSIVAVLAGALLVTLILARQTGDWRSAQAIVVVYLSHPLLDLVTGYKPLCAGKFLQEVESRYPQNLLLYATRNSSHHQRQALGATAVG